jgi:hypothetical protein
MMFRLDEIILDKLAQPVADFMNRHGVSHLRVAAFLLQLSLGTELAGICLQVEQDGISGEFLNLLVFPLWLVLVNRWVAEIQRDADRVEGGACQVPLTRARDKWLRLIWLFFTCIGAWHLCTDGSRHAAFSSAIDVMLVLAFYLRATYPQVPRPRRQLRLAHAEGAA